MASGLGVTLAVSGAYLTYCSVRNVAPVQTLIATVQKPAEARAIFSEPRFLLDPNVGTSNGAAVDPAAPGANVNTDPAAGNKIVAFARSQIGKPYVLGGTGNPGWDCSGLTQAALKSVGVDVPHSALQQMLSNKGVLVHGSSSTDTSNLLPGDIIFPDLVGDHVGIYAGGGKIIHAPRPGTKVSEIPVWAIFRVRRFTGITTGGN